MSGALHRRATATAGGPYSVQITPETTGWVHASLRVVELPPGGQHTWATGGEEMVVLPLEGSAEVSCEGASCTLSGRPSVFAGPTDFAYLPVGAEVGLRSASGGRFALCGARAGQRLPFRHGRAADVPVELRGAGQCSRQVHNFAMAGVFAADRLIACEVITPGGNWSSYPPHKHDEESAVESELEEIYYYEVAPGPGGEPGMAYQRAYGTDERPIELMAEVRDRDVVLVPHGWHGPSMAAPGHDLYYLNVMAGPGAERAWRAIDDPAHAWVRHSWAGQRLDARLPLPSAEGRS